MITAQDLSETSPAAPGTVVSKLFAQHLDAFSSITVFLTLAGATGGTLGLTLQVSSDGTTWRDWFRSSDVAAAAAAVSSVVAPWPGSGASVAVGTGTGAPGSDTTTVTVAIAKNTVAPGTWGKFMRAVWTAGALTSAGAAQTIRVEGMRPTG